MQPTPASLLERLKRPGDTAAWERFLDLYTPLLYRWVRRLHVPGPVTDDLVQEVFVVLVRELPRMTYDPARRFRGWLWTVLLNKWREQLRRAPDGAFHTRVGGLDGVPVPDPAEVADEEEYRRYLVGRALRVIQADFQAPTWRAFWECTVVGRPAQEVAAEVGLSAAAVYAAKARVLRRLRQDLAGLLD